MIFHSFLYGPNPWKWEAVTVQRIKPAFPSANNGNTRMLHPQIAKHLAEIKELQAQIESQMNKPVLMIHARLGAVDVEEYRANFESFRQEAIRRAAEYAPIRIGKNEDGSIWVDISDSFDPAAALEKMRSAGGYQDIPWKKIEIDLRMRNLTGIETLDQVALVIDYFASEYAQYKTRIERQYSGEEQAEALARLDELFAEAVGQAAESFAAQAEKWFQRSGMAGEREAIADSFLDIYAQRAADYLTFIAENPDYARIMGSKDEWLLYSGEFMGEMLRFAFISEQPEKNYTTRHGYSLDELVAVGFIAKETSYLWKYTNGSIRSDEELGTILGIAAMKFHLILDQFNMRQEVKTKLEQTFDRFLENEVAQVQAELERWRNDPLMRNKEPYQADVNRRLVSEIIRRLVNALKADDPAAAFRDETMAIVTSYRKKMLDETTGRLAVYYPSQSKWVTWLNQQFTENWNRFIGHLSAAANKHLDVYRMNAQFQWVDAKV